MKKLLFIMLCLFTIPVFGHDVTCYSGGTAVIKHKDVFNVKIVEGAITGTDSNGLYFVVTGTCNYQ